MANCTREDRSLIFTGLETFENLLHKALKRRYLSEILHLQLVLKVDFFFSACSSFVVDKKLLGTVYLCWQNMFVISASFAKDSLFRSAYFCPVGCPFFSSENGV